MLKWVVSAYYFKEFSFELVQYSVVFMSTFPKSIVGLQYFTLREIKMYGRDAKSPTAFSDWTTQVRVDRPSRGKAQSQFNLLFKILE